MKSIKFRYYKLITGVTHGIISHSRFEQGVNIDQTSFGLSVTLLCYDNNMLKSIMTQTWQKLEKKGQNDQQLYEIGVLVQ
jgi:hypothetical protein